MRNKIKSTDPKDLTELEKQVRLSELKLFFYQADAHYYYVKVKDDPTAIRLPKKLSAAIKQRMEDLSGES